MSCGRSDFPSLRYSQPAIARVQRELERPRLAFESRERDSAIGSPSGIRSVVASKGAPCERRWV